MSPSDETDMLGRNLKLLWTIARTEGPFAVIGRLAFRYLHVHTFLVFRLRLAEDTPKGQMPRDIEFLEVSKARLRQMRAAQPDLPEYFYRDENDETAARCWVGVHEGKLGFIAWISYKGSSNLVKVGPNEAEMAYIYCLKELRGRHLTRHAVLEMARVLRGEGTTALLATPHSRNHAMVKTFVACGFSQIGAIRRYASLSWPRTPADYSNVPDPVRISIPARPVASTGQL